MAREDARLHGLCPVMTPSSRRPSLHPGNRHDLEKLDRAPRHPQMWVAVEYPGRRIMGVGLNDRITGDVVLGIRGAARRDLLGFAERSTKLDDRLLVLLG